MQLGANFSVSAVGAQSHMQADVKFTDSSNQITQIGFINVPGSFNVGAASAAMNVQTQNSGGTAETVNGNGNSVTISVSSNSPTGR